MHRRTNLHQCLEYASERESLYPIPDTAVLYTPHVPVFRCECHTPIPRDQHDHVSHLSSHPCHVMDCCRCHASSVGRRVAGISISLRCAMWPSFPVLALRHRDSCSITTVLALNVMESG